ncbi:MAG: PAS domain-containing protein [Methanomicrobia archaeon]|nr:PAS domain-containing protein [Methanomicrobia archaeon]
MAIINFNKVSKISYLVGEVYAQALSCSNQIEIATLECRRAEKNFFLRREDGYIKQVQGEIEKIRGNIKRMKEIEPYIELPVSLDKIDELATEYLEEFQKVVQLLPARTRKEGTTEEDNIFSEDNPFVLVSRELQASAPEIAQEAKEKMKEGVKKVNVASEKTKNVIVITAAIASIAGFVIAFFILQDIGGSIGKLMNTINKVEKGDTQARVNITKKDEFGILGNYFNEMLEKLDERFLEITAAKDFLNNILESMDEGVVTIDMDMRIKTFNKGAERITDFKEEEVKGLECYDIFRTNLCHAGCPCERIRETGKTTFDYEANILSKDNKVIPVSVIASPIKNSDGVIIGTMKVFRDISELANLQKQLIQSEKLASVGRLAAGVAHEISNPLTGVLTYNHFLLKKVGENDLVKEYSEKAVRETMRCRKIIRALLDFARQTEPEKELADINKIVKDTLALIENQASLQNIKIITELNEQLPMIMVDSNQIQEVFTNIILNALDAMPDGGLLTISDSLRIRRAVDGRFIEINFIDTGCGIPAENLDKLFDPFFTTKKVGEGTGLGLSVSYGIIEKHNGAIEVQSEVGKGSIFVVKLPVDKG